MARTGGTWAAHGGCIFRSIFLVLLWKMCNFGIMSYVKLYYHVVFGTKYRQSVISPDKEGELFALIMKLTQNKNGKLIRINAAYNHIHILVSLPSNLCVADYVRDVKRSTSMYIQETRLFPKFWGWNKEYFATSVSEDVVGSVKQYIIGQKEHHAVRTFEEEWLSFLPPDIRAKYNLKYLDE